MNEDVRDTILETIEASLEAQLGAVRKLRKSGASSNAVKASKGKSQMDMTRDVLAEAGMPLHLKEIVARIDERFGIKVDIDSLGSALTKRVIKGQGFYRPAKNTFALVEDGNAR